MISLDKYGFRSAAAFLRTHNLPEALFDQIAQDKNWCVRKQVLLHIDCPLRIREQFRQSSIWYERLVATMAGAAPPGYYKHAKNDPDPRVNIAPNLSFWKYQKKVIKLLLKLEVLEEQ